MDHVVYVDAKEKELQKLLAGSKKMIIRAAAGRKLPYGRVAAGDALYFIENNGQGRISARGRAASVFHSEKLDPDESKKLVESNQGQLQLTPAQFERVAGKRYVVLIGVEDVQAEGPYQIDRSAYGNMDDWLPVGDIASVRVNPA